MTPTEVKKIAALLEFDWPDQEELARAMIETLDTMRADRKTYVGVIQLDLDGPPLYQGVGYFPGEASARKAILTHPAAGMASKIAVVPVLNPKGFTTMVAALDAPPLPEGDWALVREDAKLYKLGWDGKQATRKTFLNRLNAK